MSEYWSNRQVLVTGGASFIGSHLVDALLDRGAKVRAVDDLSSGSLDNLAAPLAEKRVELTVADLRDQEVCRQAVRGVQTIFHLAADHGGRGYVDTHQAGPASNLFLDGLVFWEALAAGVEKVVYASSGCVYPNHLQGNVDEELFLTEDLVNPPYDADNMYGWAKLMAELTLQAYHREHGLKAASCRYFTVYGPRAKEDHAVIAMLGRALVRQDPFEVWGTGEQIRNWTYVDDIVSGTILAGECIDDGTAINLGTMERIRVLDAAHWAMELAAYEGELRTLPGMPTGPLNRVASNRLARELLDWAPQVPFREGLRRTWEWYCEHRNPDDARRILAGDGLIERRPRDDAS